MTSLCAGQPLICSFSIQNSGHRQTCTYNDKDCTYIHNSSDPEAWNSGRLTWLTNSRSHDFATRPLFLRLDIWLQWCLFWISSERCVASRRRNLTLIMTAIESFVSRWGSLRQCCAHAAFLQIHDCWAITLENWHTFLPYKVPCIQSKVGSPQPWNCAQPLFSISSTSACS